ncbi:hypothetical protein JKP88DRAFT_279343 [Tribonema minus]|uniref:Uncharacterized protein n=1 Tax=Tribonema minus TaxID=303371 RepID=A0A835Z249_9STRA|nr:hypothetical protein JKP88DRAFT_279343 [Tribonema minus]
MPVWSQCLVAKVRRITVAMLKRRAGSKWGAAQQAAAAATVVSTPDGQAPAQSIAGDSSNQQIFLAAMISVGKAEYAHNTLLAQQRQGQPLTAAQLTEAERAVDASIEAAMLDMFTSLNSRAPILERLSLQSGGQGAHMFFKAILGSDLGVCGCALLITGWGKHTTDGESKLKDRVIEDAEKRGLVVTLYMRNAGVVGVCTPQLAAIVASLRSELGDPACGEYTPANDVAQCRFTPPYARCAHREALARRAPCTPPQELAYAQPLPAPHSTQEPAAQCPPDPAYEPSAPIYGASPALFTPYFNPYFNAAGQAFPCQAPSAWAPHWLSHPETPFTGRVERAHAAEPPALSESYHRAAQHSAHPQPSYFGAAQRPYAPAWQPPSCPDAQGGWGAYGAGTYQAVAEFGGEFRCAPEEQGDSRTSWGSALFINKRARFSY